MSKKFSLPFSIEDCDWLWDECRKQRNGHYGVCSTCDERFVCWTASRHLSDFSDGQNIVKVSGNMYAISYVTNKQAKVMTMTVDNKGNIGPCIDRMEFSI